MTDEEIDDLLARCARHPSPERLAAEAGLPPEDLYALCGVWGGHWPGQYLAAEGWWCTRCGLDHPDDEVPWKMYPPRV